MKGKNKVVTSRSAKRADKKQTVETIPDTPVNVAKALFGIKSSSKKRVSKTRKIS